MFKAKLPEVLAHARRFTFDYSNLTEKVEVAIQLPDMTENDCELSGEWGPHYKVAMQKNQMIRVGYKSGNMSDYSWYMLFPEHLVIESPILHSVRKETPYMVLVHDEVNNLRFEIFLDARGCIRNANTTVLGGFAKLRMSSPTLRAV